MNKFQLHFGDYFHDGHGMYSTVLVQSPLTYCSIREIYDKILRDYPVLDSIGIAREYNEPIVTKEVWEVICSFDYPAERLCEKLDDRSYENFTMDDFGLYVDTEELCFTVEAVADIWIWMLNARGAMLEYTGDVYEHFFIDDGYGCFMC